MLKAATLYTLARTTANLSLPLLLRLGAKRRARANGDCRHPERKSKDPAMYLKDPATGSPTGQLAMTSLRAGMCLRVCFLQPLDCNIRIDLRGRKTGVT